MKKERLIACSAEKLNCFNPCSNGMKKELVPADQMLMIIGFNPCSNGMKKERSEGMRVVQYVVVLILVLME